MLCRYSHLFCTLKATNKIAFLRYDWSSINWTFEMYNVTDLTFASSCETISTIKTEHICPALSPSFPFIHLPSSCSPGNHWSAVTIHSFHFLEFYINGIFVYIQFCLCLLSFSIGRGRLIHLILCINNPLTFVAK